MPNVPGKKKIFLFDNTYFKSLYVNTLPMPKAKDGFKVCTKCKQILPIIDYHKNHYTSDGMISVCKMCARIKRTSKESKAKESLREKKIEYKLRKVKYAQTEKGRLYYSKEDHRYITRYRGKKVKHTLSYEEWILILNAQKQRCAICNIEFDYMITPVKDCIIPMIKGGALTFDNTQALCNHCNAVKHTKSYSGLGNRWRLNCDKNIISENNNLPL